MISKDKQYRTRDGREVRIYATDGVGDHAIHGAVKNSYEWTPITWNAYGISVGRPNSQVFDLIETRPRIKREYWVNVFPDCALNYPTKELADYYKGSSRIACVKVVIDCEEGEGL